MRIQIETDVRLLDEEKLRTFYAGQEYGSHDDDLGTIVADVVVDPGSSPVEYGCEIVDKVAVDLKDGTWRVRLDVEVSDAAAVIAEAARCYQREWGNDDPHWRPDTLGHAVHEIMTASNPNPSQSEMGFEVVGVEKTRDVALDRLTPRI